MVLPDPLYRWELSQANHDGGGSPTRFESVAPGSEVDRVGIYNTAGVALQGGVSFVTSPQGEATAWSSVGLGTEASAGNFDISLDQAGPTWLNTTEDRFTVAGLQKLDANLASDSRNAGMLWGQFSSNARVGASVYWEHAGNPNGQPDNSIRMVVRTNVSGQNNQVSSGANAYTLAEWIAWGYISRVDPGNGNVGAADAQTLIIVRESDPENPIIVNATANRSPVNGGDPWRVPGDDISNRQGVFAGASALALGWDVAVDTADLVAELQSFFTPPTPPEALTIATEDGQQVDEGGTVLVQKDGGTRVTVSTNGTVDVQTRLRAQVNGITCFAGVQGQGIIIVPANTLDATRTVTNQDVTFVTPPLPQGQYDIVLTDGDGNVVKTITGALTVVAQEFRSATTRLRSNVSRNWRVGPKTPTQSEFPQ